MASKAVTIGDLIHRVASSCLSNRFPGNYAHHGSDLDDDDDDDPFADFGDAATHEECPRPAVRAGAEEGDDEARRLRIWEEGEEQKRRTKNAAAAEEEAEGAERAGDAESLMAEVFDAVSGVRRAYAALQGAHCPWDPDRMRAADAGVVAELRHLARLRDRFRRAAASPGGRIPRPSPSAPPLREAVAPYEAALDDLRRQLQGKQAEVDGLKEKLATATNRRNARLHPSKKHHHTLAAAPAAEVGAATAELFVACAEQARAATRAFAAHLLHLLRAAGLDPAAATRSVTKIPVSSPQLAKHALEAHATAVLLGGFEHESFYLDGSLSSLLDPAAFRRERYAQFRDMRGMDPGELLGVLPTCAFGRYAASKFASLLPPRVEEAVLGSDEHKKAVGAGAHPRTPFYGEFLRAAKAVWLLHLLAFALEPPPSHFEAGRGAEFHPEYMESVAEPAPRGAGMVVGFAVAPGFKLCNAAVVRARVYLVPRGGSRQ
ncbi:protein GRAVITROPIC IN THE LIGHT 1-like [Triticum dicoccoides]|uniref:protein GRAVITROPIC IN THE LIGHT 1-like n=1 Tax=Triticum dicoccoides TaxID=85692 RepID=UPI000E7A34B4|nr:protein GRAVITROPIC IN THE LIGHT 1-like [Triticum dicoccoides]